MVREIASMIYILLLAATVRSLAHMPLGISDRNSTKEHKNTTFLNNITAL